MCRPFRRAGVASVTTFDVIQGGRSGGEIGLHSVVKAASRLDNSVIRRAGFRAALSKEFGDPSIEVDRKEPTEQGGALIGVSLQYLFEPTLRYENDLLELVSIESDEFDHSGFDLVLSRPSTTIGVELAQNHAGGLGPCATTAFTGDLLGWLAAEHPLPSVNCELERDRGRRRRVGELTADVALGPESRQLAVEGVDDGIEDGRLACSGGSGDGEDPMPAKSGEVE